MTEVLAVIAIVVALATVGVMFYLDRKRNPRREFTYEVTTSPLVSTEVRGLDQLTVSYAGTPLTHPYLVTVRISSTGRADISSSSFDGQKPILFNLNVRVLGEIEQVSSTDSVGARLQIGEGKTQVELAPSLLPKGFIAWASYLCDGKPTLQPRVELADIPVRDELQDSRSGGKTLRSAMAVGSGAVGVLAAFLADILLR